MLILSVREDTDFFVQHKRVVVTGVYGKNDVTLKVEETGKEFRITDEEATEIMPDVLIATGGYWQAGQARIVIDAPKSMRILRGEKYRESAR